LKRSDLSISKTLCEERLAGLIRAFRERQRCRGIKYESSARYAGVDFGNDLVDCFFLFTSTACREDTFRFCYDLRHSFGFASPLLGGGASTVTPVIYVALPVADPVKCSRASTLSLAAVAVCARSSDRLSQAITDLSPASGLVHTCQGVVLLKRRSSRERF
jgi:hypothetical protein